jgi:S-adenosylmethionine synthetase
MMNFRRKGIIECLRPDGKLQVTMEYDSEGKSIRIDSVVVSIQHNPDAEQEHVYKDIDRYN